MAESNSNEPAFPGEWRELHPTLEIEVVRQNWYGLSKREYFAIHAPSNEVETFIPNTAEKAAHWLGMKDAKEYLENDVWKKAWIKARREWADNMLAELAKEPIDAKP
jgi:hypothetical protein